jgi:hypothetical protein
VTGIDWLALARACVADIDAVLDELPTRAEREPVLGAGEGGDDTTAVDAAAEAVVIRRLEELGADLTLVSEELGRRTFGAGGQPTVVVDPIDGSVNAKRGIRFFSLSLAVADGPTIDDVRRNDDAIHDVALGKHAEQPAFIVDHTDGADVSCSHEFRGLLHGGRSLRRVRLAVAYHVSDQHRNCLLSWL